MVKHGIKNPVKAVTADADTEKRILKAARQEFIATGLNGARMQHIADSAKVNKALLHYYFRTKEKLYEESLKEVAASFWEALDKQLKDKEFSSDILFLVRTMVTTLIRTMSSNPDFPRMMIREVSDGGQHFAFLAPGIVGKYGNLLRKILGTLASAMEQGTIKKTNPVHYILSIFGLAMGTFFMQPVLLHVAKALPLKITFNDKFYNDRIDSIVELFRGGIFTKGERNV